MAWTTPRTWVVGEVVTAAILNTHIRDNLGVLVTGGELDYKQETVNSAAVTATTEGTAVAVITGNPVTYDGAKVLVEFFMHIAKSAQNNVVAVLLRDATVLGQLKLDAGADNVSPDLRPWYGAFFDTPSAGSHTYKVALFVSSGNATMNAGAGGTGALIPSFLRVRRAA